MTELSGDQFLAIAEVLGTLAFAISGATAAKPGKIFQSVMCSPTAHKIELTGPFDVLRPRLHTYPPHLLFGKKGMITMLSLLLKRKFKYQQNQ